jgi:3-keto-disaccharide hydrolase
MKQEYFGRRSFLCRVAKLTAGIFLASTLTACQTSYWESGSGGGDWVSLFNGRDLSGWVTEGDAAWSVKNGQLIGMQGPNRAPGDLFTAREYDDFEVVIEYKIQWPANSGVWFRYQTPEKAYQADILEYANPECYSGTLYSPGKMFLDMNEDPALVDKEGWNTMKIRAQGDHLVITLNGTVAGDVRDSSYASGRIGFQIHAGDQFKDMRLTVRRIRIREL